MATGALREEARAKLKLVLHDPSSPISDETTNSDDFLTFANAEPTSTDDVDYFLADQDTNVQMLNRYP